MLFNLNSIKSYRQSLLFKCFYLCFLGLLAYLYRWMNTGYVASHINASIDEQFNMRR